MNTRSKTYLLLIVPVLALFLLILTNVNPLYAQIGVPPGSYKDSCKDIQVMPGSTLWAQCEKANGDYQKSTLRFANCEGDISNNNGRLSCKQKTGKQPPNGSYKNSCKNIRVDGKKLKAKCEKKNGNWNSTSINYKKCSGDISNNNGELSCNGSGGGSKIPKGSYRDSCKNSYVESNRLYSNCKKNNGGWNKTSMNYKNCNKDIKNDNGNLTCGGSGESKIPKGSYRDSCKNSYVESNRLYSNCKKNNGGWNKTSMNYKNCNKDIKNNNGNLTCGSGNNSKFPKGSYKKSCKNLYKEANILEADCKNDNGKWKHSSIRYKNCSNGIRNDNGRLRCN